MFIISYGYLIVKQNKKKLKYFTTGSHIIIQTSCLEANVKIDVGIDGWLLLIGIFLSENRAAGLICLICATAHELGHIFAAKLLKIRLRRLTLGFAGARIYPDDEGMSYKKEFFLCAGGPMANLCFTAIVITIALMYQKNTQLSVETVMTQALLILDGQSGEFVSALYLCATVSLLQAAVNLLFVDGLDGGRMLVSLISQFGSAQTAHRAEKICTAFSAVCLWLVSVYLLLRTGSGIGILVSAGCMFVKMCNSTTSPFFSNIY